MNKKKQSLKQFSPNLSSRLFRQSTLKMSNMPLSSSLKSSQEIHHFECHQNVQLFPTIGPNFSCFYRQNMEATPTLPPLMGSEAVQTLHVLFQVWAQY